MVLMVLVVRTKQVAHRPDTVRPRATTAGSQHISRAEAHQRRHAGAARTGRRSRERCDRPRQRVHRADGQQGRAGRQRPHEAAVKQAAHRRGAVVAGRRSVRCAFRSGARLGDLEGLRNGRAWVTVRLMRDVQRRDVDPEPLKVRLLCNSVSGARRVQHEMAHPPSPCSATSYE